MEEKVAIVHTSLSSLGGGERVSMTLVEALNNEGITPDVYCNAPISKDYLEDFYGKQLQLEVHPLIPIRLPILGIYQRIVCSLMGFQLTDYDVVVNTTGIYTPLFFKNVLNRYIQYVYNPVAAVKPFTVKETCQKYSSNLFWRMYFQPYYQTIKRSVYGMRNVVLLAVSQFTKWRIQKYWGKESRVVYPPVDIRSFSKYYDNEGRDGVISIGRFTPEKNHLAQLEIAEHLPDLTFRLCGSARTPYYQRWFRHIQSKVDEMQLDNVELYCNVPFKELLELIGESRYFIHTLVDEDFGLTTCEAIAGGCVPVVHNSGGGKESVPCRELRFDGVGEAIQILRRLEQSDVEEYRTSLRRHIQQFSEDNFQNQMIQVIFGGC